MNVVSFALPYVLPLFLGSATSVCYQYVKKASAWVDAQGVAAADVTGLVSSSPVGGNLFLATNYGGF